MEPKVEYVETEPVQSAAVAVTTLYRSHEQLLGFRVRSDADFKQAADADGIIAQAVKTATERRLAITRPLDAAKKGVMDLFRPAINGLTEIQGHLRREMQGWRREKQLEAEREQQRLREETRRKLEAERQAQVRAAVNEGRMAEAEEISTAPVEVREEDVPVVVARTPTAPGVTTRTEWTFEVVDPEKVPREFLVIDERALQAVATSRKEQARVPGVRFFSRERIVRTGR